MLIFDAHLDLAWNAIEWNRNLEVPVEAIRRFERSFENPFERAAPGDCTVSFPELRRGQCGIVIATLLARLRRKEAPRTFYQTEEAAHGAARGQLAYYEAMVEKGVIRELPDAESLRRHAAEWQSAIASGTEENAPTIGYILSMEGAWPILRPSQVADWYAWGLRIVGPAHYGPNRYCHGTGSEGGLTEDGRELLREMSRVGMLLDATHLADQSFWEALEVYDGPVLASHHNCRSLVPGDRQLTDDQLRALIGRGAVIGAAFDNWMLLPGWKKYETSPDLVSMEHVADHIDHVCQLAGNARHSGIGTDLDGGFGREQTPGDLDTIADVQTLAGILQRRGYSDADIAGIFHQNYIDFLLRAWT